jgi:hypothetical protein
MELLEQILSEAKQGLALMHDCQSNIRHIQAGKIIGLTLAIDLLKMQSLSKPTNK